MRQQEQSNQPQRGQVLVMGLTGYFVNHCQQEAMATAHTAKQLLLLFPVCSVT